MKLRWAWTRNDILGVIFFTAIVLSTTFIYQFEEKFDKHRWQTEPKQRYKQVDDIIDRELLIGKSKKETLQFLGNPKYGTNLNEDIYIYKVGITPSFTNRKVSYLHIIFKNKKVSNVIYSNE